MQKAIVAVVAIFTLLASGRWAGAMVPATQPAQPPLTLHPKPRALAGVEQGPIVQLADGHLLCVREGNALTSDDKGVTWTARPMFTDRKLSVRPEQGMVKLRDGSVVVVFLDDLDKRWKWNDTTNVADGDVHLYVWSARSTDGGRTWTDVHRIQDGYSGAIRDIIETSTGRLVVPVQKFSPADARHVTIPYFSDDGGKSWKPTRVLDIDGRGHHDGAMEATVVERRDKSLWMLLRSNHGYFYESISIDNGLSWSDPVKTTIEASSSPGLVKRLASGRLVLIWNREHSTIGEPTPRRGDQHSTVAASWYRAELSVAFSDDDGKSFSPPIVIAHKPGTWLAYPYLLEPEPGLLWITTMQGGVRIQINESDLVPHANR